MEKYTFKPYSKIFHELFLKEKERITSHIKTHLEIEHVGSTAIPNLGGKGIIDIAIAVSEQNIDPISTQLQELGYEFKPKGSTFNRLFFIADLPDPEENKRRYHIHLTSFESSVWKELISFRNYLRNHPDEVKKYGEIKRKAANEAHGSGEKYRKLKEPLFKKIKSIT